MTTSEEVDGGYRIRGCKHWQGFSSSFLVQHSANILDSQQYGDGPSGRFFMRVHFALPPPGRLPQELESGFSWVAEAFHMSWRMVDAAARTPTLIMVSRLGHCLNDLLFRWRMGSLRLDIAGVVSNIPTSGSQFHPACDGFVTV